MQWGQGRSQSNLARFIQAEVWTNFLVHWLWRHVTMRVSSIQRIGRRSKCNALGLGINLRRIIDHRAALTTHQPYHRCRVERTNCKKGIFEKMRDKKAPTSILAMVEAHTFANSAFNCWHTYLIDGWQRIGTFVGPCRHPKLIIHYVGRSTSEKRVMFVAPLY